MNHSNRPSRTRRPQPPETPRCDVSDACGGCPWLDVPYPAQLDRKGETVQRALAGEEALAGVEIQPCLPSPWPQTYRNRAKLAVRGEKQVRLGLFERGSDRLVGTETCTIHRPVIQAALPTIAAWLGDHGLAAPGGPVRYVDVREARPRPPAEEPRSRGRGRSRPPMAGRSQEPGPSGAVHLTLVVDREIETGRIPAAELDRRLKSELAGLAININPHDSSYVFGEQTRRVWRAARFAPPLPGNWPGADLWLQVPATGFFQVNASQIPPLAERIAAHLEPAGDGPWLDLYSGIGTWGICTAHVRGGSPPALLGIEEHPRAADCAQANARAAGLARQARYLPGRVEDLLDEWTPETRPAAAVLNPGRPGCRPAVLDALVAARPSRLAYLSCNPATLARDLAHLVRGGLFVSSVLPVDMMPHTEQVEALALLGHTDTSDGGC